MQFLFNSEGQWIAFRDGRFVFDTGSEWIGWLPWDERTVVDIEGEYLGTILRSPLPPHRSRLPRLPGTAADDRGHRGAAGRMTTSAGSLGAPPQAPHAAECERAFEVVQSTYRSGEPGASALSRLKNGTR